MASRVLDRPLILAEPTEGPLKVAFDSCQKPPSRHSTRQIVELEDKLTQLIREEQQMLGIETDAKAAVQLAIKQLRDELKAHRTNLPVLSVEAFKMRDDKGYPLLVPFAIDKNTISISGSSTDSPQINLPLGARKYYQDVVWALTGRDAYSWHAFNIPAGIVGMIFLSPLLALLLAYMSFFDDGIRFWIWLFSTLVGGYLISGFYKTPDLKITARYTGVIPPSIKDRIRIHRNNFDEIAILAEVDEWVVDKVATPKYDPLVIGHLQASDSWHLLGSFNTTPLEHYVEAEFTI